jgi:menaquinone-dependent protoporphyrinogen IX oxidase
MGNYTSKSTVSDPAIFATLYDGIEISNSQKAQESWKSYDYVIVGAGIILTLYQQLALGLIE